MVVIDLLIIGFACISIAAFTATSSKKEAIKSEETQKEARE